MRVLVAIPHYYNPEGGGGYGSLSPDPTPRIAALRGCLQALASHWGLRQQWNRIMERHEVFPANGTPETQVDMVVCTTGEHHVLDRLELSPGFWDQVSVEGDPKYLGFACHRVLADRLGSYDYYAYMEDDLILHDPWFFVKLAWFSGMQGNGVLLQPNRYEMARAGGVRKVYIDFDVHLKTGRYEGFEHYRAEGQTLQGRVMGQAVHFRWATNPHAGCFFLNAEQMAHWARQPHFGERRKKFFGPLESAATMGLMQTFRIFKPSPETANFLEVEHFGEVWSNKVHNTISR